MRTWFFVALLAELPALGQEGEQLFNGKNLDGWKF